MYRLAGCALMLACGFAFAQGVTKWVDEKGRVHYGDRAPTGAREQAISRGTTSSVGGQAKPAAAKSEAPKPDAAKSETPKSEAQKSEAAKSAPASSATAPAGAQAKPAAAKSEARKAEAAKSAPASAANEVAGPPVSALPSPVRNSNSQGRRTAAPSPQPPGGKAPEWPGPADRARKASEEQKR